MTVAALPPTWQAWIASLTSLLHARLARRVEPLLLGAVLAKGRKTVAAWLRAAGIGRDWKASYYLVAALGRAADTVTLLLVRLLVRSLRPQGPLVFALDDTPTKRYGRHVQGAGLHHNPSPGPAGQRFVYGHVWVTLAWLMRHPCWGTIGLPLRALLYVRRGDVAALPKRLRWRFRTKLELAAELARWLIKCLRFLGQPLWLVTDGAYAKRPLLKVARQEEGVVLVSRLRKDAALYEVPRPVAKGRRRPGRPRLYGRRRISLAKRAGQKRGWQEVRCRLYGKEVVQPVKTFEATYKPAGGRIRVVLVRQTDGWRAYFATDPTLGAAVILEKVAERFAVEQDFHDLKEVEGAGQQQLRNIWANVGAYHVALWVHCLTELWAWWQPKEAVCDRSASPWDRAARRPSHADRRKALVRCCLAEGFSQLERRRAAAPEIREFVRKLIHQAA